MLAVYCVYVLLDVYSPVDMLGITIYTDIQTLCPVCVTSGMLSTLPCTRSPHSHQMFFGVVVGSISCGQVSIKQPHEAVGEKTGSTGGRSIPTGHLPGLCIGLWLFGIVSSSYFSTVSAFGQPVLNGNRTTT